MNFRRHLVSAGLALAAFLVLTLISSTTGVAALVAAGVLALALTAGYFHYRRRTARAAAMPATPVRDDRLTPQTVKMLVSARDNAECKIKGPACTVAGEDYDHKVPYEWGGSSKDPSNIQVACHACNIWKGNRFADTPGGRVTREEYMRMMSRV